MPVGRPPINSDGSAASGSLKCSASACRRCSRYGCPSGMLMPRSACRLLQTCSSYLGQGLLLRLRQRVLWVARDEMLKDIRWRVVVLEPLNPCGCKRVRLDALRGGVIGRAVHADPVHYFHAPWDEVFCQEVCEVCQEVCEV